MYRRVIDTDPSLIFVKDWDGKFLLVNKALADIYGSTPEGLLGKSDADFNPCREETDRFLRDDREVMTALKPKIILEEPVTDPKRGGTRWFQTIKVPLQGPEGRAEAVLGVATEITDRKRADEALRRQNAFNETLIDASPVFFVAISAEGKTLLMNRAMRETLGYRIPEVLGADYLSTFIPKKDHAALGAVFEKLVKDRQPTHNENRVLAKDGRELLVEWHGQPVFREDGNFDYFFGIGIDLTEKRKLEAQYLRAQRLESIGTLASGIAHDLNNVLSPILMAAPLLKKNLSDPESRRFLDLVESNARRGVGLIRQVMTFSRGTSGERVAVHLAGMVKEMRKIMTQTFPKSIEINIDLARDLRPVLGDPTQMHQILLNLCVNARDAMPQGGAVTISAKNADVNAATAALHPGAKAGPYALLCVEDTGEGIPPEILDKIFDPFFTTKEPGKGTGLGLATVTGLVKSHGGFLAVDSRPGKGAKFQVYLPAAVEAMVEEKSDLKKDIPQGRGQRILVVDDEAAMREIARAALSAYGYNPQTAADGTEALTTFVQNGRAFDLVLLDMSMPVMDGTQTIKALRHIDPQIRVVVMSGTKTYDELPESVGNGIRAFLPKPFSSEQLAETLHDALS